MSHLSQEQLTGAYYGDLDPESNRHIGQCAECRSNLERLTDLLDSLREYPVPGRGASYGGEVWTRLLPKLPATKQRYSWLHWWTLVPAAAALLALTFIAGVLTEQRRQIGIPASARERVLLMAMSDHLERSQIVLTQLLNGTPEGLDWVAERERARDLITENRLLRQTALHSGDAVHAALLDDLERVLLDVANSPSAMSAGDLDDLRHEIENQGLLFKVRITSVDARQKGQKL